MNYGMFGLKEGRESRLNVMKRRTSFLGKTKGWEKRMKKWLCIFAAVWVMISVMAVASAEPGYEFVKLVLEDDSFLGDSDYSVPAIGEEYSSLLQSIRETTGEYGTFIFMNIDMSEGKLGIIGENAKGLQEFTLWSGVDDAQLFGMLYVFMQQYDDITSRMGEGTFIILYTLDDGDSNLVQDSQTAAALSAALDEIMGI